LASFFTFSSAALFDMMILCECNTERCRCSGKSSNNSALKENEIVAVGYLIKKSSHELMRASHGGRAGRPVIGGREFGIFRTQLAMMAPHHHTHLIVAFISALLLISISLLTAKRKYSACGTLNDYFRQQGLAIAVDSCRHDVARRLLSVANSVETTLQNLQFVSLVFK
jgi:hypothetical protein